MKLQQDSSPDSGVAPEDSCCSNPFFVLRMQRLFYLFHSDRFDLLPMKKVSCCCCCCCGRITLAVGAAAVAVAAGQRLLGLGLLLLLLKLLLLLAEAVSIAGFGATHSSCVRR